MRATPSITAVVAVGAAALIAAVSTAAGSAHHPDARAGTIGSTVPSAPPPAAQPSPVGSSTARPPGSVPAPRPSTQLNQGSSGPNQAGDRSASGGSFTLTVSMRSATISTEVAPIRVGSHQVVDPPHSTAQQWNTAAWVQESTYPATPAAGTSYVYGHACHYHVCPFTNLKDARPGDQVRVRVPAGLRVYTIVRTGLSEKSAPALPSWAADSTVPNRIVLITCAYEQGDTSTQNIVVVARLTRD